MNLGLVPEWHKDALCREIGGDVFFPESSEAGDTSDPRELVYAAKRICRLCDVQAQCLEYALQTREPYGVWGGRSAKERRRMSARARAS